LTTHKHIKIYIIRDYYEQDPDLYKRPDHCKSLHEEYQNLKTCQQTFKRMTKNYFEHIKYIGPTEGPLTIIINFLPNEKVKRYFQRKPRPNLFSIQSPKEVQQ
jgi:hypothetical protein